MKFSMTWLRVRPSDRAETAVAARAWRSATERPLTPAALRAVAGGINPQPLPPHVERDI